MLLAQLTIMIHARGPENALQITRDQKAIDNVLDNAELRTWLTLRLLDIAPQLINRLTITLKK